MFSRNFPWAFPGVSGRSPSGQPMGWSSQENGEYDAAITAFLATLFLLFSFLFYFLFFSIFSFSFFSASAVALGNRERPTVFIYFRLFSYLFPPSFSSSTLSSTSPFLCLILVQLFGI